MKKSLPLLACLALAAPSSAAPRSSADYSIGTESFDGGGRRALSGDYTNDGSVGVVAGQSSAGDAVARHGYVGQLYDLARLALYTDENPRELAASGQLYGFWQADDSSYGFLSGAEIAWSVLAGPIESIAASGLMTAGAVFQDTPAMVRGEFAGFTAELGVTVLDVVPDNFGSYAGDGLGDDWQVQHFGQGNADAAPGLDPDGDGQTNAFEYAAGLSPNDPQSRLSLAILPGLAPGERRLVFSPRFPDRTYAVEFRPALSLGPWEPLVGAATFDDGSLRVVTDSVGEIAARYYRVVVTKP